MAHVSAQPVADTDLSDLTLWRDGPPHEVLDRLRLQAPVHWSEMTTYDGQAGFWSLTRHADVRQASMDWETFSSERGGMLLVDGLGVPMELQRDVLISMDPPRHARFKGLFQRAFTPRTIAAHEVAIREITVAAVQRVAARGEGDLVVDIGAPVTARVIGSLLGTDPADDERLGHWGNSALAFEDPEYRPDMDAFWRMMADATTYTLEAVAARRSDPRDDLMTALAQAEINGDRFTDGEIIMQMGILVAGGTDSTKSVYTNLMHHLLQTPADLERLLADPSLIPQAIEEALRCFPAFGYQRRTATRDVELGGQQIREGDKVALWLVAGNRDPEVYEHPHTFDLDRRPDHQAFGAGGRHFCLGAALARLELRVLMEETLRALPMLELAGPARRTSSTFLNQFKSIPVKVGDPTA
ncbi:MAG: cytochrome P450 [Solirubrobacteraceae bacterium]|nr:cytochrome P450 [Solirubrobacteraceae bacterium]